MSIEEEKIDQIIEAHSETVEALKADRDRYKEDAEKLPSVKSELEELKSNGDDGWKEKHDAVKAEFEKYKSQITAQEAEKAKEAAARAYFESKNITGKNLELAIRGSKDEIKAIELDGDKIKDTSALDALVSGDFSALVSKTQQRGANLENPPGNEGSGGSKTKEEILAIKDGTVRRQEMAKHPELFGIEINKE